MTTSLLQLFAQAAPESDVTIEPNVQPVTTDQAQTAAGIGIGPMLFFIILGIINLVFFVIAIIHLVKNPDVKDRTLWIILSIFIPFGSWVYVLGPRRTHNKQGGTVSPVPQNQPAPGPLQGQRPLSPPPTSNAPVAPTSFSQPQPPANPSPQPTPFTPTASSASPQSSGLPQNPPTPSLPTEPRQRVQPSLSPEGQSGVVSTPTTPPAPNPTAPASQPNSPDDSTPKQI